MNTQRTKNAVWSWEAITAACCFAGGIGSALLGSVLTASTWIVGAAAHPWLRGFGTAFLILTIPLLIFSGYCMDWMERDEKQSRKPTSESGERGSVGLIQVYAAAILLSVVAMAPLELHAQQTIFNVPTTDVLDRGKLYFELDISAKPNDSDALNKFSSFVPRLVMGAGSPAEVGLNIFGRPAGVRLDHARTAVKWKVCDGKDNGWA
jgi:hypothetical protein